MMSQIVAALAMFALGAVWYSPALFAVPWMKLTGIKDVTPEMRKKMVPIYAMTLFGSFIAATAIKMIMIAMNAQTVFAGVVVGLMAGIAFVFTAFFSAYSYTNKPMKLLFIDAGYQVTGLVVMGIVLSFFM